MADFIDLLQVLITLQSVNTAIIVPREQIADVDSQSHLFHIPINGVTELSLSEGITISIASNTFGNPTTLMRRAHGKKKPPAQPTSLRSPLTPSPTQHALEHGLYFLEGQHLTCR